MLCAVFVTGLAGSALTAEIGIMRITEQIDALPVMALNPMRYLVVPAIVAGVITFPLMVSIFDVVGIFGGYLVGVKLLGLSPGTYFGEMQTFVDLVRHHGRLLEGAGLRAHRAVGLHLQGLQLRPRRRGGGARDDPGGGALLGADPRLDYFLGSVLP